MNEKPRTKTIDLKWKTWLLVTIMVLASGLAAYIGAKMEMSGQFESRIADIEKQLQVSINSTFYTLQKPASYIISQITSGSTTYYCLQNGATGKLDYYSADCNKTFAFAVDNTTVLGGTIFVKAGKYAVWVTLKDKVRLVIDSNATGVNISISPSATCWVEDKNSGITRFYSYGALMWDENQATGAITTGYGNFTKTLYCVEIENATTDGYVRILRLVVESDDHFPSAPSVGYTFFHEGDNRLYVYNGTQWIAATEGKVADHGALTGLENDDHTIYLLAAGSRALTDNWNIGGSHGIYGATWLNTTSISFTGDLWWGNSNRTDVIANPLQSPTFIVYMSGSTFCMKNTLTGQVTYEDTDAFKVLNFSLNNCSAGEYVYLQPGSYDVGPNSLVIPAKVGLCSGGMCDGAVISGGNVDVLHLANSWSWVSDLMVSASSTASFTGSGIKISSQHCRVSRVQIVRQKGSSLAMGGSGLKLEAGALSDAVCENVRIDGNFTYGVHLLNTGSFPYFYINNNYFENVQVRLYTTSGWYHYGYCLNRTSSGEIAGNTFIDCKAHTFNGTYYYINRASGNDFYDIGNWDAADKSIAINVTDSSAQDNLFFGGFIEGTGVVVSNSGTRTRFECIKGFATENSGVSELANGDSFNHGLAGVPTLIILTVEETDANYFVQVKAKSSTSVQIYLFDFTAGVPETVKKTIHWYAEHKP